ncbi:MAG: TlpA family protein disulfide reductase [Prevotellaceae bacterium]|nr:TlpA family protein disulfide reductase [Prevotellaceae bacterium]
MRRLLTFMLLAVAVAAGAFVRDIKNPRLGASTTRGLDFVRIEMSDTATVLHSVVHFRPHWWIKISPNAFIEANGKKYPIKRADGIKLGEEFYMPDSGVTEFTLTFGGIPEDTKSINFKEDENSGWKIWDIDLTGSKNMRFPAKLLKKTVNDKKFVIPDPVFECDTTTVNVHLLGYHPEMGDELRYFVNSFIGQKNSDTDLAPAKIDENGNAVIRLFQAGTCEIVITNVGECSVSWSATLKPGETIDLNGDMALTGYLSMRRRDGYKNNDIWSWHNGHYAAYNMIYSSIYAKEKYYGFELHSGEFGDYHMDGDQYIDYIIGEYNRLVKSINEDKEMTKAEREVAINKLNKQLVMAAQDGRQYLMFNYWNRHDNYGTPIPDDSIRAVITPEHLRKVAAIIDIDSPKLLTNKEPYDLPSPIWSEAGISGVLWKELNDYVEKYGAAESGKATDADIEELRKLSKPFYADAVERVQRDAVRKLSSLKTAGRIPTPDVAANEVFDAIMEKYKGKVVVVDLWNTWCGPCRASIKMHEPEKSTTFASEDIVWVYIADESSPALNYYKMINDIKGEHYLLTREQIGVVRKRFEVDGIPYYIMVDREGNATGRPDMRDPNVYKTTILDALKAGK